MKLDSRPSRRVVVSGVLRPWIPVVGWLALEFGLSSIPGPKFPKVDFFQLDKLIHVVVYAGLGALICRALQLSGQGAAPLQVRRSVILTTLLAALFGMMDEMHQLFVPGRKADWRDVLADLIGGGLGAAIFLLISRWSTRDAAGARPRA